MAVNLFAMEYRFPMKSGLKVSFIRLGSWLTYDGHVEVVVPLVNLSKRLSKMTLDHDPMARPNV